MARLELVGSDVQKEIEALRIYRSGWENQIREGWAFGIGGANEILYELYEISGCIIIALEDVLAGRYRGKMAIIMTKQKLEKLVKSKAFDDYSTLGELGACNVITTGTRHHIRVMFEDLEVLTR